MPVASYISVLRGQFKMSDKPLNPIFTIGYGHRSFNEFLAAIRRYDIKYVIDIRSKPFSRYKPEFSRETLSLNLERCGVRYHFMGEELGGRPEGEEFYTNGKVVYSRLEQNETFQKGISRLETAARQPGRVCLMCSEARPEQCHRSKLIGHVLQQRKVPVNHIGTDNEILTQDEVLRILTGGQLLLFEHDFKSRRPYSIDDASDE